MDKDTMSKVAAVIGYGVYVITILFGIYLIFGDPEALISTKPSLVQIGGLLLICYGLVEVGVTFYNRLPPVTVKTQEQVSVNKAKIRERNDAKSKEISVGKKK